ncbi:hypothetical protein DENIS_1772 [Desulfonema ishimotonii]|uniref:Type I restriction modification DNA specificity domain-containing protein n=1 Tax=Desulfonema ishimotonii TaxID=45657 RepID=A0A401FV35_9BACT|nr:hypothetical protein DENIS_1772 [Desulfonema ishimotonii]
MLKYAFEGKLTEEWRKQHQPDPAEKLLEQIRLERERHHQQQLEEWKAACEQANAEGKKKPTKPRKPKELPPLTEDELGELPALPEGWCWTKLGKITDIVGGVTKGRKLDDKKTVKLPYLRVANVQDGYLDLKEIKHIRVLDSDLKKYRLVYGDILFTEGGDKDKLGRGSVWKGEIKNCIHQNHIFRARTINNDVMLAKYISYSCQTQTAKKYYFDHAKQTVNLASINMTVLSNTPIPITNSSEQHAIVQEIESRLSVCDKLEQTIETNLRKSDALRQSILKKAFEGKLVPQNPDDEPAEKLLERIQLEKAELDAKTKAAKAKKKKKRL